MKPNLKVLKPFKPLKPTAGEWWGFATVIVYACVALLMALLLVPHLEKAPAGGRYLITVVIAVVSFLIAFALVRQLRLACSKPEAQSQQQQQG